MDQQVQTQFKTTDMTLQNLQISPIKQRHQLYDNNVYPINNELDNINKNYKFKKIHRFNSFSDQHQENLQNQQKYNSQYEQQSIIQQIQNSSNQNQQTNINLQQQQEGDIYNNSHSQQYSQEKNSQYQQEDQKRKIVFSAKTKYRSKTFYNQTSQPQEQENQTNNSISNNSKLDITQRSSSNRVQLSSKQKQRNQLLKNLKYQKQFNHNRPKTTNDMGAMMDQDNESIIQNLQEIAQYQNENNQQLQQQDQLKQQQQSQLYDSNIINNASEINNISDLNIEQITFKEQNQINNISNRKQNIISDENQVNCIINNNQKQQDLIQSNINLYKNLNIQVQNKQFEPEFPLANNSLSTKSPNHLQPKIHFNQNNFHRNYKQKYKQQYKQGRKNSMEQLQLQQNNIINVNDSIEFSNQNKISNILQDISIQQQQLQQKSNKNILLKNKTKPHLFRKTSQKSNNSNSNNQQNDFTKNKNKSQIQQQNFGCQPCFSFESIGKQQQQKDLQYNFNNLIDHYESNIEKSQLLDNNKIKLRQISHKRYLSQEKQVKSEKKQHNSTTLQLLLQQNKDKQQSDNNNINNNNSSTKKKQINSQTQFICLGNSQNQSNYSQQNSNNPQQKCYSSSKKSRNPKGLIQAKLGEHKCDINQKENMDLKEQLQYNTNLNFMQISQNNIAMNVNMNKSFMPSMKRAQSQSYQRRKNKSFYSQNSTNGLTHQFNLSNYQSYLQQNTNYSKLNVGEI